MNSSQPMSGAPPNAAACNDLGIAFANQGRLDEAAAQFRQATIIDPAFADGYNNLGNILKAQGKLDEAVGCYERAIALKPNFAMAHNNLGITLRDRGNPDAAVPCHQRAIALKPDYAEAHYNLGNAYLDQNMADEAQAAYQCALALAPNYVEAHNNRGNAFKDLGRFEEAEACYRHALMLQPNYADARYNLANAMRDQGKFEEAVVNYQQALALRPQHAETHMNVGNVLRAMGKFDEAQNWYRRARELDPQHAGVRLNESLTHLLTGNFTEGWRGYEWRWRTRFAKPHPFAKPLWDGSELQNRTIFLHCEQGLGDNLQFIRYAPMLKARGGRVLLSCPQALARLFKKVQGVDQVFTEGETLPDYDYQAPLLSLPMIFGTTLETVPHDVPYLAPEPAQVTFWAKRMEPYKGKRIGLVWAGNPRADQPASHAIDRRRSMRLEQFAPLASVPDVQFFSLQKGTPAEQLRNASPELKLVDFMDEVIDFADTAAIIANLDLIISVDTSVVHLAGAMGKPVWVLSRFDGCWRWLLNRDDSPWYPSLRLFRQPRFGDWDSVIMAVKESLKS